MDFEKRCWYSIGSPPPAVSKNEVLKFLSVNAFPLYLIRFLRSTVLEKPILFVTFIMLQSTISSH